MKVVFIGSLHNPSASGKQRLWALEKADAEVYAIDKQKFLRRGSKVLGKIARFIREPYLTFNQGRLYSKITSLCREVQPDIIWFEWPREISGTFLTRLKKEFKNAVLISFQDDNPWGDRSADRWMWKRYFECVPFFDLHLVKRHSDINNLSKYGAKLCRIWEHGIYSPLFHLEREKNKKYPISFVGTCMDDRAKLIETLLSNQIPVHVFGTRWEKRSMLPKIYPNNFHPPVVGEAYADVIRESQICLGLVSHSNKDEWTMRSYEVPGCGGLLLAEATPAHLDMFEDGKDAVLFSSYEQCLEKVQILLQHKDRCSVMGRAAYDSFVEQERAIEQRMASLLSFVKKQFNLQ